MNELAAELQNVSIENELKQSYLDYAMSVIVGRALPDVCDGLKPVHRRILYAMNELGNDYNKPYKKSARIVGDVIGKYHPHGDVAVYDSIVRMAQEFSMRYILIYGQGNFGSIDGDPPAAMRYTEIKMAKITKHLLDDLDKNTVDFAPNYDDTELLPTVLPTKIPNLLVNGSSGIAVGMATNIPPHNLYETINGCLALLDNPNISTLELMQYIPGPDFPTYGIITGKTGIIQAYDTGRGRICIRSRTTIDSYKNKQVIIVTELPYQVNKARLIERIAELVKEKKIEGISGLRDESDKDGMRIVIEIKRGESAEVVLNNLYLHTQLQVSFNINMIALVNNEPKLLNLKSILQSFLNHRCIVVSRRTEYELSQAKERAHILEGLSVALMNIDRMIELIKSAKNLEDAKQKLLQEGWSVIDHKLPTIYQSTTVNPFNNNVYHLSSTQAQAILDLKLQRLTGLEQEKIWQEFSDIMQKIAEYQSILANHEQLLNIVKNELRFIQEEFKDKRRTEIIELEVDFIPEDLIPAEDVIVTLSHEGYVKTQSLSVYNAQHRGGRGKAAASLKEEDVIHKLLIANTHDTLLCFSNFGKAYWLKVYQIPSAETRTAKGLPIINLLALQTNERISTILPIKDFSEQKTIFMATAKGTVKQVELSSFQRQRQNGIIAINLVEGDTLVGAELTTDEQEVMLTSNAGKSTRFRGSDVRDMGRTAKGVRGIKLKPDQKVISLIVLGSEGTILTATKNGFGKRTEITEFSTKSRGGQGVLTIQTTQRNGEVIGALQVKDDDELLLITNKGTLVRIKVAEISVVGRNTQGVKLINLDEQEYLVAIEKVVDVN